MANRDTENHEASTSSVVEKSAALAKLSLPRLAEGVARPRLFEFLDNSRRAAATWIAAPGGAGKTTLAATYLLERELPYLWYQLDQDDADPATFFYYLGLAAKQALPDQEIFLPLLTPEYLPDIPGFARRYFRQLYSLLPVNTVLVLDNYQDLGDAPVFAEILRSALAEIPEQGHLFIISRSDPPSVLARHRTTGALSLLDWETLRLTLEETEIIVGHDQPLDGETLQRLYQRADGWPAGVTLLLEQIKRKGTDNWAQGTTSLETIFDFFTNEFFDALPESLRDFLLQTALLAHMTPSLAEQVTQNPEAGHILADLHRRHFFTNRRDLGEISYQYHALFREFLLAKLKETYSKEACLTLTRNTGQILSQHKRHEEAVTLHLQAQDWETAVPLVLEQAPQLMAQGRAQIVAGWIQQFPEELVEKTPWLLYWKGVSQISVNPFLAISILQKNYGKFIGEENALGRMLTAAVILDITYLLRLNLLSTPPWLDAIQNELNLNPHFPSPAVEARILTTLLSILTYTQPSNAKLRDYAQRLTTLLGHDLEINQKVVMGAHLVDYYAQVECNIRACDQIALQISPLLNSPELTVINELMWRSLALASPTLAFQKNGIAEIITPMLPLIRENNLGFLECVGHYYILCMHASMGENGDTQALLDRMRELANGTQPGDLAHFFNVSSRLALASNNYAEAIKYGEKSLQLYSECGVTLTALDMNCLLSIAYCEAKDIERALEHLTTVKNQGFGNSPRILSQALQIESYILLSNGNMEEGHKLLRRAHSMAQQLGIFGSLACWYPPMASRLCTEALRDGIEMDYALQLIRKRNLAPEDASLDEWPWPIKVYTLGQFSIYIDNASTRISDSKQKPLELLKILISFGCHNVKAERIAEILWPDAEGDAAVSAFTTTLSRLRKKIGEESIIVKSGRVSLDERHCWLDVRALERSLDESKLADADREAMRDRLEKLLTIYRGPFLGDEEGEWVRRQRDRARETFAQHLSSLLTSLRAAGASDSITYVLERVENIDPAAERRCRELMKI